MKRFIKVTALVLTLGLIFFTNSRFLTALADTASVNFEPATYSVGNINAQDGWSKTGSFDSAVVANTYGFPSFGTQALRISDAVASGSFGDQTFAKPLNDAVGETTSTNGAFSAGTKQTHFEAQFDIASADPALQSGMHLSFSPDRGDGSRMSYLRFDDMADGIHVFFDDVTGVTSPVSFNETEIATISRAPHTIKLTLDAIEGPSNDVVKVYIDGNLIWTGTSWENYYRYDAEASAEQTPRIIKTTLFRVSGTAHPANAGKGFLIDNLSLSSGAPAPAPTATTTVVQSSDLAPNIGAVISDPTKWLFYNDENDTINSSLGSFVSGPATAPLGSGSAQISVSGTERRNLATYQFSGTKLGDLTTLKFSTYNPSAGNGGSVSRSAYLQFNVDFNGSDTWQRRLVFVPSQNGSVSADGWKEWDAIQNGNALWGYSGATWPATMTGPHAGLTTSGSTLRSWNSILADYPGVRMRATDSFFGLRVGEPYANGYTENIDKVIVGTATAQKTFDFEPTPAPTSVKVTIDKYINGVQATAGNTQSTSFPMHAVFPGGEGDYALGPVGFNNPDAYKATTSDMPVGSDYSTFEKDINTTCTEGAQYALVGYTTGDTLAEAASGMPTVTVPSFTNLTSDKFVIVWNKTCVPMPTHLSPADNSVRTTAEQTLIDWSDVTNWFAPISYVYQAAYDTVTNPDGSFLSPVYTSTPLSVSEIPTPGTPPAVYYWHVKAVDAANNSSPWTFPWKITVDNTPPPMCVEDATQTVVSDTDTQVDEHGAIAITPHPAYVSIPGATWIWSEAFTTDGDNELSAAIGSETFTKTFSIVGTPLNSELIIASDNTYTVMVNGSPLDTGTSGTDSDNFTATDTWTIPAAMLVTGSNTISFTVDNQGKPDGYTGPNPAGLLYKLTVHQNECVTPDPVSVKVHVYKYLKDGATTAQVPDDSTFDPFPMTATWDANIGAGTADYVLGDNHGGTALRYAADTSAMLAPVASYTTFERTDESSQVLPVGAQCVPGKFRLVGYKSGGSLETAQLAEPNETAPVFSNFSTDQYVIVVNEKCADAPTTGSIEITKYVCPANTAVVRSANGVDGTVPAGCTLQDGKTFGYVHGEQTDANAPYPELGMPYTAGGSTVAGVLIIADLPSAGRYLVSETNNENQKLADGDILGLYCIGDGDTSDNNDNQELTFVPAGGAVKCVAYNKAPVTPPTDMCPNIEGNQESVPEGKELVEGQCVDIVTPQTDVCPNIDGAQSTVPDGKVLVNGQCVNPGRGGGGIVGGGQVLGASTGGQVLGASTACGLYVADFLKMGKKNNSDEVKKLQEFLNDFLKLNPPLPINGVFGLQTFKAVVKFQEQEFDTVLKPWGLKKGTGYVYKTTTARINNLKCPELNLPIQTD